MNIFLAKAFKKGEKKAFEELYETHYDKVIRLAIGIMKNEQEAKDAVQIAFLRAYEYRHSYNENKPFSYWINRILINECKRILSGKNRVEDINYPDYDSKGIKDEYRFEKYELLYNALQELTDEQRIPLLLKYINGFKEMEIAEILGLKGSTVKSRLYEGRKKIKDIMLDNGYREYRYE